MTRHPAPAEREKALDLILRLCKTAAAEEVRLGDAHGRILRRDVKADRDAPPFDRAAMDGYAVRSRDFEAPSARLRVVAEIPAGILYKGRIRSGLCARIMTGAPMPAGADAVVPVEESEPGRDGTVSLLPSEIRPGVFVHRRGADIRKGRPAIAAGAVIGGIHSAALASFGAARVKVSPPVRVNVLTTGSEVVPPSAVPGPQQIRNANGPGLMSFLARFPWVRARSAGTAGDDRDILASALGKALRKCDVLAVTGGVSAGRYDFVPAVLESLGVKKVFHGVALRPGRPLWFGTGEGGTLVFGLPGNPVSVFAASRIFMLPALRKIAGAVPAVPPLLRLPIGIRHEKFHSLEEARIASLADGPHGTTAVMPIEYSGSADFVAALQSDGLMMHPADKKVLKPGAMVDFMPW